MSGAALPEGFLEIPEKVESAIRGLDEPSLDLRGGTEGWSIRETVHHLLEANLVLSTIVIAALAKSGSIFDWSWLNPDASWMGRVGYTKAPTRAALSTLKGLVEHVAALASAGHDHLDREVQLQDAPGAKLYSRTVRELLLEQVAHVDGHLKDVASTRAAHGL